MIRIAVVYMLRVAFIFFRHFFPGIFGSLSVERAFTETAITFRPRFEQEKKEATGSRFVLLRGRSKQFFRSKIAKLSWEKCWQIPRGRLGRTSSYYYGSIPSTVDVK